MKDLQIINKSTGKVEFSVRGEDEDTGFMLLQRLYVIMFSDVGMDYREITTGVSLLDFVNGTNKAPDALLTSTLAVACASALNALDKEDRNKVESFSGKYTDDQALFTLKLVDGTTLTGVLKNE